MIEISHAWLNGELVWEQMNDTIVRVKVHYCFVLENDIEKDNIYSMHAVYDPKLQKWEYQSVYRRFEDKTEEANPVLQIFADEIGKEVERWFDHSIEYRIKNKLKQGSLKKNAL
ncbi:hypothetical protein [Ammoniphilus sp. 3BR4]|uniref:hypothetical protein n=1 Tax=Ammoniphilus sp. 3BR4 TaxID=3158265 RepID=UPI003466D954